ncbi:MFS transporter [Mycobacterium sp. WMMD1722]|uniref:MFS transporter n=1 Tax=Mycobacterium sp. WMMD1722 TaxID=3404117 RepID=UPI003BF4A2AE
MRRVAAASFVGTAIEYYDFYIYGTAAALVFPRVFFPDQSPTTATIASFATFAVAFLSRPLGAGIVGHFGDRIGRKRTLVATLLIMGIATVAVGLVPSAESIGVAAPLILLTLRLAQGFAVGGEWAGAALLSAEHAPPHRRGMYGMFPQLGVGAGLVLSNVLFLVVNTTIGERSPAFMSWGWRVPFLFSAVLVIVALYVRLSVAETPVFAAERLRANISRTPVRQLFGHQRRQVMLATGVMLAIFGFSFMGGTYLMGYANTALRHPRELILAVGIVGGLTMMAMTAVTATLCDRLGRRRLVLLGFAIGLPWSFAVLPLLDTGSALCFAVGIAGTYAVLGVSYGPLASFIPEIFATRYRYSGAGLAFNLGGIVGGAVPPLISGALLAAFGSWAIGLMMGVLALASLASTALLPETMGTRLDEVGLTAAG